ncbi:hypothetical protein ACFYT3_01975 [Nocardia amikacinitolerans]|uniref:hypothetical protein n=1 Tax=Nocardia amikacinitolerans TaxID=756689 RepID=UPI0036815D5D
MDTSFYREIGMQNRPVAESLPVLRADDLATKEFDRDGVRVSVVIGRPVQFPGRAGWRCRVRVERGSRLEQSQVVAPTEREVLRLAMDLVTGRLELTEAQFLDGAAVRTEALRPLLDPDR